MPDSPIHDPSTELAIEVEKVVAMGRLTCWKGMMSNIHGNR